MLPSRPNKRENCCQNPHAPRVAPCEIFPVAMCVTHTAVGTRVCLRLSVVCIWGRRSMYISSFLSLLLPFICFRSFCLPSCLCVLLIVLFLIYFSLYSFFVFFLYSFKSAILFLLSSFYFFTDLSFLIIFFLVSLLFLLPLFSLLRLSSPLPSFFPYFPHIHILQLLFWRCNLLPCFSYQIFSIVHEFY